MARPLRIEFPGAFYYITSKGYEKDPIYRTREDYYFFLFKIEELCKRFNVFIHSYCLTPNNFHMLIETKEANLSSFMKRLLGDYTIRFNKKYSRSGHLFQGRFKSILIEAKNHLVKFSKHIHQCPQNNKETNSIVGYEWSSLSLFADENNKDFFKSDKILNHFSKPEDYINYVKGGVSDDIFKDVVCGGILGSEEFINETKKRVNASQKKSLSKKKEINKIPYKYIEKIAKGKDGKIRIYAMWKWGGYSQQEIGVKTFKTKSAISQAIKRIEEACAKDEDLRIEMDYIEKKCLLWWKKTL